MYIINNISFRYKYELINFIKNILHINKELNNEDKLFIFELFKLHPNFNEKMINSVSNNYNCIDKTNFSGSTCFAVKLKSGELNAFSYHVCLNNNIDSIYNNNIIAFRNAITNDISNFKNSLFDDCDDIFCDICNIKLYNNKKTHVDHKIKFRTLLKDFCDINNINLNNDNIFKKVSIKYYKIKSNENILLPYILDKWVYYHNEKANLRLLCACCNMKIN